jgi:ThiF family
VKWSITFAERDYELLRSHLFPGDDDEHGAVFACGMSETGRGTRLLVREVFLAEDGKDFVTGQRGYKQFSPLFVADKSGYCRANGLAYVSAHNHGGRGRVGFSPDDLRSHERGYPALVQMTGKPVTALVFAEEAVAGRVVTGLGRPELESTTVIGPTILALRPGPAASASPTDEAYDRQARMFGARGQEIVGGLKVAVIGLGGGGSLINQMLARLGVGHILAVDPDDVEVSNVSRIPGATRRDALGFFPNVQLSLLRRLAKRTVRPKVAVAERVAREANSRVRFEAVQADVMNPDVIGRLLDCDFVFLATDTMQSRHLFNQIVHQYLVPGA